MRLELTHVGLIVKLANDFTTQGTLKYYLYIYIKSDLLINS